MRALGVLDNDGEDDDDKMPKPGSVLGALYGCSRRWAPLTPCDRGRLCFKVMASGEQGRARVVLQRCPALRSLTVCVKTEVF